MDRVEDINNSRYAQMQSSIGNKLASSATTSISAKPHLLNKFSNMEEGMRMIDDETRQLVATTMVPTSTT